MITTAVQSHLLAQPEGTGLFTGYARANNLRVAQLFGQQMLAGNQKLTDLPPLNRVQNTTGLHAALSTTISPQRPLTLSARDNAFLKNYRDNMLHLRQLAVKAQTDSARDALIAGAQDPNVLQVSGRLADAADTYEVNVRQLASGQTLRSAPLRADDPLPTMSGTLRLETQQGNFDFYLSAAGLSDNAEMLQSFADSINAKNTGVTAAVQRQDDGTVSLQLEEENTARPAQGPDRAAQADSFQVKGTLAKRLNFAQTAAAGEKQAIYSVRKNGGEEKQYTAGTNTVRLDDTLTAKLKGVGSTTVTAAAGVAERTAQKLADLVDGYNETVQFLRQNGERSTGALNQLRRLSATGTEDDLRQIGLTAQRDGTLRFDRSSFLRQASRQPTRVQSLVEDFAQSLRSDAVQGMKESSGSLVSPAEYTQRVNDFQKAPINVLSSYTRNGVLNLMNMYAAGVLMNLNI